MRCGPRRRPQETPAWPALALDLESEIQPRRRNARLAAVLAAPSAPKPFPSIYFIVDCCVRHPRTRVTRSLTVSPCRAPSSILQSPRARRRRPPPPPISGPNPLRYPLVVRYYRRLPLRPAISFVYLIMFPEEGRRCRGFDSRTSAPSKPPCRGRRKSPSNT